LRVAGGSNVGREVRRGQQDRFGEPNPKGGDSVTGPIAGTGAVMVAMHEHPGAGGQRQVVNAAKANSVLS